jgi:hypothetical protein
MKKVFVSRVLILVLSLLTIISCKKDDKELNMIVIKGSTDTNLNGTYIPELAKFSAPVRSGCEATIYYSEIMITFEDESSLYVEFKSAMGGTTIPVGTYTVTTECEEGFSAYFDPMASSSKAQIRALLIEDGTITVTKKGEVYDIDVDGSFYAGNGGGTVKGNFSGTLAPGLVWK